VVAAIEALPTQIMELDLLAENGASTARDELRQALAQVDEEMTATGELLRHELPS
jgi:hypothetical protein